MHKSNLNQAESQHGLVWMGAFGSILKDLTGLGIHAYFLRDFTMAFVERVTQVAAVFFLLKLLIRDFSRIGFERDYARLLHSNLGLAGKLLTGIGLGGKGNSSKTQGADQNNVFFHGNAFFKTRGICVDLKVANEN